MVNYDLKGMIFNIQKYSVNDGPGIRTVVFFKGCPLRCKWCSNPESQSFKTQILWNQKSCVNCFHCKDICHLNAIGIKDGHINIDHKLCDGCEKCVKECPNRALETKGKLMSVKEVIDIVKQDEAFYEESGGGMTLSGGEFLSQYDFATELLKAAKENNINTCCETSGQIGNDMFIQIAKHLDQIFIDVKHYDNKKHIFSTAISNQLPFANLKWAVANNKNVYPRIPVIPNYNDSLEDAKGFVEYLKLAGATKVQLLPFHQFGENKYKLLNASYDYEDIPSLHKEDLKDYQQVFIDNGIDAYF